MLMLIIVGIGVWVTLVVEMYFDVKPQLLILNFATFTFLWILAYIGVERIFLPRQKFIMKERMCSL